MIRTREGCTARADGASTAAVTRHAASAFRNDLGRDTGETPLVTTFLQGVFLPDISRRSQCLGHRSSPLGDIALAPGRTLVHSVAGHDETTHSHQAGAWRGAGIGYRGHRPGRH